MKASGPEKAKRVRRALEWGLCLLFCLCISGGGAVTILCMTACAALAAPPLRARLPFPKNGRVLAVALLFTVGCIASPIIAEGPSARAVTASQTASGAGAEASDDAAILESAPGAVPNADTMEAEAEPSEEEAPGGEDAEVVVYITKTGTKYHVATCGTLKQSKIEITLEEAKAQGYEPCKLCNPPS